MSAVSPQRLSRSHAYRPGLSAAQVDRELKHAVQNWRSAEQSVVLWFAELHRRRLYQKLGFGTIHLYATESLGFSRARSYQFLKLAERLKELPTLRKAVASGELGWTKARAVATVATKQTQKEWLRRAQGSSRRELEREIDQTKRGVRATRLVPAAQMALGTSAALEEKGKAASEREPAQVRQAPEGGRAPREGQAPLEKQTPRERQAQQERVSEIPLGLSVTLTPEQFARYEALVAQLRQCGHREAKGELLLAALSSLLADTKARRKRNSQRENSPGSQQKGQLGRAASHAGTAARVTGSPYQVRIQYCPRCESASVSTGRGDRAIDRATLQAALCDAKIQGPGQRTRSTLPPRIRRQVLERDRHRCRMPGCEQRHFLAVHHILARKDGGKHELTNLITLCASCHRALHALSDEKRRELFQTARRKGSRRENEGARTKARASNSPCLERGRTNQNL